MLSSLRSRLAAALIPATMTLISLAPPPANGQKPSGPPAPSQSPSPRKIAVITNDNLQVTVLSRTDHPAETPPPQTVAAVAQTPAADAQQMAQKAVEIAALQKQIKDKQKRIELLMRLFVTDEKKFVQFSGDLEMNPDVQSRIRNEQEELRRESAACAQLQARLDALQGATPAPH
jgi:hypothetical protein